MHSPIFSPKLCRGTPWTLSIRVDKTGRRCQIESFLEDTLWCWLRIRLRLRQELLLLDIVFWCFLRHPRQHSIRKPPTGGYQQEPASQLASDILWLGMELAKVPRSWNLEYHVLLINGGPNEKRPRICQETKQIPWVRTNKEVQSRSHHSGPGVWRLQSGRRKENWRTAFKCCPPRKCPKWTPKVPIQCWQCW